MWLASNLKAAWKQQAFSASTYILVAWLLVELVICSRQVLNEILLQLQNEILVLHQLGYLIDRTVYVLYEFILFGKWRQMQLDVELETN